MSEKRGGYNKVGGGYTPYSTAWRILCAIRDHKCLTGRAIMQATGICHQSVEREMGRLEWGGYLKTRPYRLTDKGLALANGPCPERTPKPAPVKVERPAPAPMVEDDGPLPASVAITDRGLDLLRFLGAEAAAGRAPTITQIAEHIGGSVTSLLARLRMLGLVALADKRPTRLGRAVLSGEVQVKAFRPQQGRLATPFSRPVESAPAPAPPAQDKPLVPASFATRGGIRHPDLSSFGYKPGRASVSLAGWS